MIDMGVKPSGNPHRLAKFVNLKLQKMKGPEKIEFLVMCTELVTEVTEAEEIWGKGDPLENVVYKYRKKGGKEWKFH